MQSVARRIGALLGMAVLVGLAALLVWRVYLHHRSSDHEDEIVIVFNATPALTIPR